MAGNSLSPDLVVAIIIGSLQLLIGLMSLWQQRRLCQITDMSYREDAVLNKPTNNYTNRLARVESQIAFPDLQRSESAETAVGEEEILGKGL